jgi:hypothetical protein
MRNIILALTFAVAGLVLVGRADAANTNKKTSAINKGGNGHGNTTVSNSGNGNGNAIVVKNSGNGRNNTTVVKNSGSYYQSHGVKFSGGFYFKGKHHNHWGHRKWDGYRRCYVYWEPTLLVYYYYNESQDAYYPCD